MHVTHRLVRLRERGDTIVEVLIAIAVISLVLGGAYVTTNRSLLATRDAQERGTALKLVESQIEQLKGVVAANPSQVFSGAPASFCISNVSTVSAASSPACAVDENGAPASAEPIYHLSIGLVTTGGLNTFTVTNHWTNVRGDSTDSLQMQYRLYQ